MRGIQRTRIIRCAVSVRINSYESITKWDARAGHPDSKLMKPVYLLEQLKYLGLIEDM